MKIVNAIASYLSDIIKTIHFNTGFNNVSNENTGEALDTETMNIWIKIKQSLAQLQNISIITDIKSIGVDLNTCTIQQLTKSMPDKSILIVKMTTTIANTNFPRNAGILIGFKTQYTGSTTNFFLVHWSGLYSCIYHTSDPGVSVWHNSWYQAGVGLSWPNCDGSKVEIGKSDRIVTLNGIITTTSTLTVANETNLISLPQTLRPNKITRIDTFIKAGVTENYYRCYLTINPTGMISVKVIDSTAPTTLNTGSTIGVAYTWTSNDAY